MSQLLKVFSELRHTAPIKNLAAWHQNAMGYRQYGLLYDDLIPDENEIVETALRRLPPNEYQNRLFRFRRALNLDSQQNSLEKHEWTTPEQDVHYLQPLIKQVENEQLTKNFFDTISENPYAHRNKA